ARRIDLCWTEPLCRRRPPGDWIGGLSSFTGHSTSRSAARNGPLTAFASLAVFAPGRRVVPDRSLATARCLACSDAPFVKARAAARPVGPVPSPGPPPPSRTVLSARRPADQLHHPHRADPARRASPGLLVVGGGGGGGPAVGGTVKGGGRGARRGPPRNG